MAAPAQADITTPYGTTVHATPECIFETNTVILRIPPSPAVKSRGVVCDGDRVISQIGQALSAGMVTSSVAGSVTGRMRQRARTSRPR